MAAAEALGEISGLPHVSLQPSAGSHGELAGVLLTRAYHEDRGERRTKVLTPDTAHGTNPATVTMAGYEVVKVGTDAHGNVDLDDLRAKADEDVACLMLTNPSTLGLFEPAIEEIARDRPRGRRDALLRRRQPERDHGHLPARRHGLRHRALQPAQVVHPAARRRRPGRRADRGLRADRAVPAAAAGRAPRPAHNGRTRRPRYDLDYDRPKSIGRLRGFQGNYGVFVRSYAYIRSLGAAGLRDVSEIAVLNANYLLARLRSLGVLEHLPVAYDRLCMHEFVLSGAPMKRELEIRTLDLAKRLLDFGVHPPTVYFPLLVEEALLVEPTETETKETLDAFAEIVAEILREAAEGPGDRPRGAVHDARPPARRGAGGAPARAQTGAVVSMRFVIFGAGAIGGVVGARLHQAGHEVALIARGAHLEAIQRDGLTLTTPAEQVTLRIPAASDPARARGRLRRRRRAAGRQEPGHGGRAGRAARQPGAGDVPIVCLQNGVENERMCAAPVRRRLRRGGDGCRPTICSPGHVEAYGAKASGIIDLGRYPAGSDERCEAICAALSESRFHSEPSADVMRRKYAKLLRNLGNAVGALFADAERLATS